jgi:DNA-binding CsgD family transcriptional regulator
MSPTALALLSRLSFREREVALRIRDGLTTREIARELRRSPLTIKTQLAGVFRKLGLGNRARIVAELNR